MRKHVLGSAASRDFRVLATAIYVHDASGKPVAVYQPEETVLRELEGHTQGRVSPEADPELCQRCELALRGALVELGCTSAESLADLGEAVKVCDESGVVLGYLSPVSPPHPVDETRGISAAASEELERRRRELRERPIREILADLRHRHRE
ncbi:MAG: hypothetical protein NUV77_23335 [Thermoguttaceae bacterium]|jgi:hypothetical protein|nr:hypothetical protein [Thermoguttaceae bacterium]